jgi:spore germination protein YaaH
MMAMVAVCALAAGPALAQTVHARDAAIHADRPVHPELIHGPAGISTLAARSGPNPRGPCWTVFGFLPYWESPANIRWDHLTHVACFSLEVNQAGQVTNARGWPWTATISAARGAGVKVLVTVTNFDPAQILALLDSPTAVNTLSANIASRIGGGLADGVVIDFEGPGSNGWPSRLPAFTQTLRANLQAQNPGTTPLIYYATPAVNWGSAWPLASLASVSDGLFVMGYDFYGSWSATSGPSGPLTGGSINVTNTVQTQYAAVRQQSPLKMILGVPYYGNQWQTGGSGAYSSAVGYVGSVTYASAAVQSAQRGRIWDPTSSTPWYRWLNGSQWNQTWYDDAESLGLKFDLAKASGLGGAGMWALGYDDARPELWDLIRAEFISPCCPADFDRNRVVQPADIFAFLNAYFSRAPGADFDGSGTLSPADVFAFLGAYFTACVVR